MQTLYLSSVLNRIKASFAFGVTFSLVCLMRTNSTFMFIIKALRKVRVFNDRLRRTALKSNENLARTLFDAQWYMLTYPELREEADSDLWTHYLHIGGFEGRQPNPIFDSKWYLEKHPELLQKQINPLVHYATQGAEVGFDPSPLFSTSWYLDTYSDVANARINPLAHYLAHGGKEGREPSPYFYASWYLKEYPEVASTMSNPLTHYLAHGATGRYDPNPFFYSDWYLKNFPAMQQDGINPLVHFIEYGEEAGYTPNPFFNREWYQVQNPDATDTGGKFFRHFLASVRRELRYPEAQPNHFTSIESLERRLAGLAPSLTPVSCSTYLRLSSIKHWMEQKPNDEFNQIVYAVDARSSEGLVETAYPRPPYIAKLKNVHVLAGTRYMMAKNDIALHDEEFHFYDVEGSALKYVNAERIGNGWVSIKFHLRQAAWIEIGINMMHEYSGNYFHFIAETIPRMMLIEEAGLPKNIPYLFEDNLHQNIRDLIECINTEGRKIHWLTPGTLFKATTVYFPSDLTTVVDAYHGGEITKQTTLDVQRIRRGVLRCKNTAIIEKVKSKKRKIFASRGGGMRKLLNQDKLEEHFSDLGFEIVRADLLGLKEQIEIFQEAQIVIGPTGAQMSNIVWCAPDTKIVILASDHPSHQLYFWALLGRVSAVDVRIVQGPRAYIVNNKYGVHDDYTVSIEDVMASIER